MKKTSGNSSPSTFGENVISRWKRRRKDASELLDTEKDVRLAIIDVMLPDGDGVSFAESSGKERQYRDHPAYRPEPGIGQDPGFSSGAAIMCQAFFPGEALRPGGFALPPVKLSGTLQNGKRNFPGPLYPQHQKAVLFKNGGKVNVTHVEYEMMKYFMTREGRFKPEEIWTRYGQGFFSVS
jgi:hypothetical protein